MQRSEAPALTTRRVEVFSARDSSFYVQLMGYSSCSRRGEPARQRVPGSPCRCSQGGRTFGRVQPLGGRNRRQSSGTCARDLQCGHQTPLRSDRDGCGFYSSQVPSQHQGQKSAGSSTRLLDRLTRSTPTSGLAIAYKVYHLSLRGKSARTIDGLTGDQRFFMD